jgi:protein tyrosine phosphatase (PTP) superfamily phosphohydrolase (DUF442 family)
LQGRKRFLILSLALILFAGTCEAGLGAPGDLLFSGQSLVVEGVPNLHKVSDDVYRSAQPTKAGLSNLKAMGIKTVIDLRGRRSEARMAANAGLGYEEIPMNAWHPEAEDAVKFLQIISDKKKTPVLVHCQHGADRTGVLCAVYQVAVQGWTKERALQEMTGRTFGFHSIWINLVRWIKRIDIAEIRHAAEMKMGVN